MGQLEEKIAVVTGAGRGIGRAMALRFAAEGAEVVCVSRTAENSAKVASEVQALGRRAWGVAVDVADSAAVTEAVKNLLGECGRVDILVNNAGVTRDGLLMRMSDEDWDAVLNTNLKGSFLFTRALVRQFIRQRSGRILNVASVIGLMGNAGQCNYAASKAALIGFTKSAARELGSRSITVNAIAPGFIETAMTEQMTAEAREKLAGRIPLARLGRPEDVSSAVKFLASEEAGYITGQVLHVNGGLYLGG
jgi:3-oxoacyl-[acyl-carrier protein] reductase